MTVTGGTKGAFAGSGARYTLAVTPTGSADVVVTVAQDAATDGLNTGPAAAVSATATWDAAAPTVGITGVPPKINSTTAFTATFTFSEAVTGFATGDVTVTGGTKGAFASTNARTYTLAVTPTSGSDVVVTVAANSATDGLNTGPAAAVSATATWDAAAPTVGITGVPPKINSTTPLSVTFTFSEDVTEFVTGDVTVTGGTKGAFASTNARTYTLAVTPTSGSDVAVTVAANSATDGLNTGPASAVSATATWDAAAPAVEIGGVPAKINSTTPLSVTFTFSEDVTEFVTGDVTVTGGTKGAFASTNARTYTLAVTPTSGSDVAVTVAANSATDGLNTGPASAVSATATWDAAAPAVEIGGVPAKINSTTPLSVTFTFSEDVTEFVTGDVTVTGGTKGAFASTNARTYTLAVTPTSGSDVAVTVAANSATDGLNTGPASAVSATATWDAAGIVLSATTLRVSEGSDATYTVRLATQPAAAVTVTITGHAGTDLTLTTASLRFTADNWSEVQTVTVSAARDDDAQDDEATLVNTASGVPAYDGKSASVQVLVAEPQVPPFMLADASSAEGRPVVFALTRLDTAGAASMSWRALEDPAAEHPATPGEDFDEASGTLEFAAGEASEVFSVATVRDELEEPSETFMVEVEVPSGERLLARGTIRDATERSRTPSRGVPALALWTDALAYLPGDSLRLYLDIDPKGEERDYAVFVSLVSVATGKRTWLDLRGERASFEPDVTDLHGNAEERLWARPLQRVENRLVWEGTVPEPGLWHFAAELRSPRTWQVLKRAHAKFVVAVADHELVAAREFDRRLRRDKRWSSDTLWVLRGRLVVPRGVTLEIEAGTQLRAWGPEARIVVEAGGRIVARGRRESPIVMTCADTLGQREPGCWGGLEVYGEAAPGAGADAGAGPGSAEHSSGELRYVRVEFAGGGPAGPGAAIRLHGAGSGTVLENVQVHASLGNGFEFRGGRASCLRCVVSDSAHSGVYWDGGWQGWAQHLYVQQLGRDSSALLASGGPERTAGPVLYNVTLVGGRYGVARQRGSAIRLEGTAALTARNIVATGFRGYGISATGAAAENLANGTSSVSNAMFHLNWAGIATPNVAPYVNHTARLPRLLNVRREPNPDPRPRSGSAALVPDNAAVPPVGRALSREAAYLGAFGAENWLEQWTWFGGEERYRATE